MLNIKKAITVLGILLNNFISLSSILMFCWLGNLYAQMPHNFPQGREIDFRILRSMEQYQPVDATTQSNVLVSFFQTPLHFIANQGQLDPSVIYYAKSEGATVYCTHQGLIFSFAEGSISLKFNAIANCEERSKLKQSLRVKPEAPGELEGKVNYFIGNDPSLWQTDIPTFKEVVYREVYPGIDLVYSGNQRRLKYTFYLQPGADPNRINMNYEGVESLSVDVATGELLIQTPWGEMRDAAPVAYQEIEGVRKTVDVSFHLMGENRVGFAIGDYDPNFMLVLDPVLVYSTYLGGSYDEYCFDIAVDSSGNTYVTGKTSSYDFPTQNPYQGSKAGGSDVFVTKLNSTGDTLIYSTYLGGSYDEYCLGIAVDSFGNAYVTGYTYSSDFPILNSSQSSNGGKYDAFVASFLGGILPQPVSLYVSHVELSSFPQITLSVTTVPESTASQLTAGNFTLTENGNPLGIDSAELIGDEWHITYTTPNITSSRNEITIKVESDLFKDSTGESYRPPEVLLLNLGSASGIAGQETKLPLYASSQDFASAHIVIGYDDTLLSYINVTALEPINITDVDTSQAGQVGIEFVKQDSLIDTKLLDITFDIAADATDTIAVTLISATATDIDGNPLIVQTQNGTIEPIVVEPITFGDFIPSAGEASQVMQGGILHRYYEVKSGEALIKNAVVHLDMTQGAAESTAEIDSYGIVSIPFDIGDVGPGYYEFLLPVISVEFSGQTLPVATPLPRFGVEVMPREWAKEWELGGSINGIILAGLDIGGNLGIQILVNDPDANFDNTLILERQLNGKIGAEVGVGASFKFGLISGKAELAGAAGSAGLAIGDRFRYPNFDQSYGPIAVLLLDQLDAAGILRNPASRLIIDALAQIYGVGIESGFDAASVAFIAEGEANVGTLKLGEEGNISHGVPFLENVTSGEGLYFGGKLFGANASVTLGAESSLSSISDTVVFGKFDGQLETGFNILPNLKVWDWIGPQRRLTLSEHIWPFGEQMVELSLGTGGDALYRSQIFTLDNEVADVFLSNQKTVAGGLFALSTNNPLPALGVGNSPFFIEELEGMADALANSSYRVEHDEFLETAFPLELKLKAGLSFGVGGSITYEQHKCYDVERGVQIRGFEYMLESGYSNNFYDPYTVEHIVDSALKESAPVIESTLALFKKAADAIGNVVVEAVDETSKAIGTLVSEAQSFANHVFSLVPFTSAGGSGGMQAFGTPRQARQYLLGMRQPNELNPYAATVGQSMLVNVEDESGELVWDYPEPLELTLYYTVDDLATVGLSETDEPALRTFWWDDSIRRWTHIGGVPNVEENSVFANISHSGTYAIGIDTKNPSMGLLPKDGSTVGPKPTIEITIDDFLAIEQSTVSVVLNDGVQNLTLIDNTNIAEHYDAIANVITYEFEEPLAAGNYVLSVHICDSAGNCSDGQSSFTVDADAFEFVLSVPADGTSDVSPVDEITVTFSKNIEPDTVNLGVVQLRNDESDIPVEGVLNVEEKTITFKPMASLLPSTAYTLIIRGGEQGIRDIAGKILYDDISIGFTTEDTQIIADKLELDASTTCPINGSTQITLSAKISDYLVSTYTGTVTFTSTDANAQLPEPYTFHRGDSGMHRFIVAFKTKGNHTLTIEDDDGLTVTSEDITVSSSPQVTSATIWPDIVPNDDSTSITFTATIIDPDGLGNLASVMMDLSSIGGLEATQLFDDGNNGDGEADDGIYGLTNITVPETIEPGIYSLEITATDNDGETGTLYLSITVIDANPPDTTIPTVTMTPSNNATGVPIDTPMIKLGFSEEMDESTLTTEMLIVEDDERNLVDGIFAVMDSTKIQYTLTNPFTYGTSYYVTLRGGALGVKDLAGNGLAGDFIGTFRTRDYGDVSGNGAITAFDAAMVLQHTVGLITLSDESQILADVSNNGDVTAYDASLILKRVVGAISEFPIENPEIASPKYDNQSYHVSLTDFGVRNGGTERHRVGESVTISVMIVGENVHAGEFAIGFNEEILEFIALKPSVPGDLIKQKVESGNVKFSFAGIEPIVSDDDNLCIAVMKFSVKDDATVGETEIRFETAKINEGNKIIASNATIEILPLQTALLPNYPNPFNPDTWLPYQLAEDAPVTINIYNIAGQLIRVLHLGNKSAGCYVSKEKAAYWNGRNNVGQKVASGIYFYTLKAGTFTATRKMVILK